jgi:hypothetical protein
MTNCEDIFSIIAHRLARFSLEDAVLCRSNLPFAPAHPQPLGLCGTLARKYYNNRTFSLDPARIDPSSFWL